MDPLGMRSKCLDSIMCRGDQPNKKVVALGWNNKIRSLQTRWQTLERTFDLPIFLLVLGSKRLCKIHPCEAENMRQLRNPLGPAELKTCFQKIPLTPLYIAPEIKRRQSKNQKLYGGTGNKRKRWNGEEVWAPGSLEWYEHEVELLRNMPVTPLCYSNYTAVLVLYIGHALIPEDLEQGRRCIMVCWPGCMGSRATQVALQDYCLNRAPWFFMNTVFLVDAFPWSNHKACSQGYMIKGDTNERFRLLNSQVAEQNNSALKRLKSMLSRMSQKPFMAMVMLFMTHWNFKKLSKRNSSMARAARAQIQGL